MEVNMVRTAASLGLLVSLLLTSGRGRAEEKRLTRAEVPRPVIEAVEHKYPGARMVAFESSQEDGETLYEVGIDQGGTRTDVELAPDGKIATEETVIRPAELPAPVKAGLGASRYAGWKIQKVERVVKNENTADPAYELVVASKKEKFEVVLDKGGKLTKEEDKRGEKDSD
jgi:hypothetical protein